jgi:hypothetical protein
VCDLISYFTLEKTWISAGCETLDFQRLVTDACIMQAACMHSFIHSFILSSYLVGQEHTSSFLPSFFLLLLQVLESIHWQACCIMHFSLVGQEDLHQSFPCVNICMYVGRYVCFVSQFCLTSDPRSKSALPISSSYSLQESSNSYH